MRKVWVIGLLLLTVVPAIAQETRSTISGTVRDEQGVIPGATVKVTNTGTGVTQTLTTNASGYFEARLLIAGDYDVVIEMEGFKTLRRSGISLGSGQQLALQLPLEIGTIAEEITVTGEAPLLEVTTLRQGLVLDERKLVELPVQSNMPLLLARFAPGMQARGVIPFAGQGFVGGPTTNATPLGGIGASTGRLTAPPTTASAVRCRHRRTPTCSRRCAWSRPTSPPRSDMAPASASR
jgi:hypothetical protein